MDCVYVCDSFLQRNEIESFSKRLITGHEKLIDKNVEKDRG